MTPRLIRNAFIATAAAWVVGAFIGVTVSWISTTHRSEVSDLVLLAGFLSLLGFVWGGISTGLGLGAGALVGPYPARPWVTGFVAAVVGLAAPIFLAYQFGSYFAFFAGLFVHAFVVAPVVGVLLVVPLASRTADGRPNLSARCVNLARCPHGATHP